MKEDIGSHVVEKGYYTLEFQINGVFLNLYIRFWHGGQLVRVFLKRAGRKQGKALAELGLDSHAMAATSTRPAIVACLGASPELIRLLDDCKFFNHGVQSPFRFDVLSVKTLMHKKNYSVFGRADFFTVLQFLVISLSRSLDLEWTILAPELTKVVLFCIIYSLFPVQKRNPPVVYIFISNQVVQAGGRKPSKDVSRNPDTLVFNQFLP